MEDSSIIHAQPMLVTRVGRALCIVSFFARTIHSLSEFVTSIWKQVKHRGLMGSCFSREGRFARGGDL